LPTRLELQTTHFGMAEQEDRESRTENATPQRLRKAREDGQLGFSSELVGGVILATCAIFFWFQGTWFFGTIGRSIANRLTEYEAAVVDPRMLIRALMSDVQTVGVAVLAVILPLGVLALMSGLLQTNFNISFKPLELKLDRLSVIAGFKRIFSSRSVVKGVLSVAKASVIVAISLLIAQAKLPEISTAGFGSVQNLLYALGGILLYCSIAIASMMVILGIADLAFQKWKHLDDMKMSMRDIKEENKTTEGDPMVRARIKQVRAEMSRQRMLQDVPQASVVITNPTHFAVAVKYDRETMDAPVVVAKGADFLAKKIIEVAKQNNVAVVERKPVARFLYKNVDIGSTIPFELYQAVAEILNYVNRMRSYV
jgi:flagellar biosynthetic protein FlhB